MTPSGGGGATGIVTPAFPTGGCFWATFVSLVADLATVSPGGAGKMAKSDFRTEWVALAAPCTPANATVCAFIWAATSGGVSGVDFALILIQAGNRKAAAARNSSDRRGAVIRDPRDYH